jgi:hypothetical protein
MTQTLLDLLPGFLFAFRLNLQVGMFALLGGMLIGLPLTWDHFCRSEHAETLLIIPNLFRIFTILVMSSSIGAAIGVKEAVSYTLIHTETMPDPLDRIMTVLAVTIFFMLFFSTFRFTMQWMVRRISPLNPSRPA